MLIFPQQWRAEFGVLPQGDTEGQVEPSKPLDLVDGQHVIEEQTRPRAKVDAKGWGCPVDADRPTIPPAPGLSSVSLIATSCSGWRVFPSIGSVTMRVLGLLHLARTWSVISHKIFIALSQEGMLLGVGTGTDGKVYARLQVSVCIYVYRICSLWNVFSREEDLLLGFGTDAKVYAHLQVLCVYT